MLKEGPFGDDVYLLQRGRPNILGQIAIVFNAEFSMNNDKWDWG